ncbi:hypothetical protein D3C77_629650 [compost metagenome]
MAQGKARHLAERCTTGLEGLHRQLGAAVPAHEAPAVVAVAVPLGVTDPQVELLGQVAQQGLVGAAAETVAV